MAKPNNYNKVYCKDAIDVEDINSEIFAVGVTQIHGQFYFFMGMCGSNTEEKQ